MMRIVHIAGQDLEIPKPKSKKQVFEESCAILLSRSRQMDEAKAAAKYDDELSGLHAERQKKLAELERKQAAKNEQIKKGQVLYARPQLTE